MQVGNKTNFATIKSIYKAQSIFGFYKGAYAVVFGCLPSHAGFFAAYEWAKNVFKFTDGVLY
jgi:hypothetical protein